MHASLSDNVGHRQSRAAARPPKVPRPTTPPPPEEHSPEPQIEPEEPSDLDEFDMPLIDDACWDVFLPDDDELYDRQPDHGDFDGSRERGAGNDE